MNEKNNKFEYTYTAPTELERREINRIIKDYQPQEQADSKLAQLHRLDKRVKNTPMCIALCIGIFGALIFGLGMTLSLEWNNLIAGIIVAIVGAAPMILAHPIYKYICKINKNKYAKQILTLSEEILNEYDKKS